MNVSTVFWNALILARPVKSKVRIAMSYLVHPRFKTQNCIILNMSTLVALK